MKDRSPHAYEKVVDRLLASPQYGEQSSPLLVRCGPLCRYPGIAYRQLPRDVAISRLGHQSVQPEHAVRQFTIDQIAGDLLPNATLDQKIASGFERCNVTTNEGGFIPAEAEAMYAKDRADTTGTVWMGLTVGCATCHDHKFDPISQKDIYSMTSFFRNTTQYPLDGNVPDTPPIVTVPPDADRQKWDELQALRTNLKAMLAGAQNGSNPGFESWLRSPARHQVAAPFASSRLLDLSLNDSAQVIRNGQPEPVTLPPDVTLGDGPPAWARRSILVKRAQ